MIFCISALDAVHCCHVCTYELSVGSRLNSACLLWRLVATTLHAHMLRRGNSADKCVNHET